MTDDLLQLITAAVDGELSPTETRRFKRGLAGSAEGRALYAKLKANAKRLRALPKVQPPDDLHKRIMARVAAVPAPSRPAKQPAERPAEPAPPPAVPTHRKFRRWVPVAVAASVLIGVTAGSYSFFSSQDPTAKGKGTRPADPETARWLPDEDAPRPSTPVPDDRPFVPDRRHVAAGPEPRPVPPAVAPPGAVVVAPEPRPTKPDLLAFPPIPETRFDLIQPRVPFLRPLAEFDRDEARTQLAEELTLDPAFRIDVFARDASRAVSAFRSAAKSAGVTLHADAATVEKLRKRQVSAVVVYTEALTPAEVAALVEKLAIQDAKYSPRLFGHLHAVPATGADSQDLKSVLGVDPGLFKRALAGERGPKGIDPSKPIGAGTGDQIVKSIAGKGEKAEKGAVLLTWNLPPNRQTPQAGSAELKQYLAKRGPRPDEAVPVLIVIRPGNG